MKKTIVLMMLLAWAAYCPAQVYLRQWDGRLLLTNIRSSGLAVVKRLKRTHKLEYQKLVQQAAVRYGLTFELLDAVITAESGYCPTTVSNKGAQGLMQLMPGTAAGLGVTDAFDPAQNIDAGARYLKAMIDRYGILDLGLAAYNAGPRAVDRYRGIPPYVETRDYVKRIHRLGVSSGDDPGIGPRAPALRRSASTNIRIIADGENIHIGN
jgi:soluble lytic murein transglycosylase-like protein